MSESKRRMKWQTRISQPPRWNTDLERTNETETPYRMNESMYGMKQEFWTNHNIVWDNQCEWVKYDERPGDKSKSQNIMRHGMRMSHWASQLPEWDGVKEQASSLDDTYLLSKPISLMVHNNWASHVAWWNERTEPVMSWNVMEPKSKPPKWRCQPPRTNHLIGCNRHGEWIKKKEKTTSESESA